MNPFSKGIKWQPLLAILMIFCLVAPAFAQQTENFTLNFPSGNGTTTVVTFQSEQDKNVQNLVNGSIVAIIALFCIIIVLKKAKGI